jgi:peptide/nickel transport system substrate-binding protein
MKKLVIPLLILLIAAFIISGCSSTSTSTATTPAATSAAITSATPSKQPTTPAAATPQYGGTLKILAGASMDNIGYPAAATPPWRPFLPQPALDDLLRKDESGNPIPNLATGWKLDRNNMTLTIYLQKGVKFHDGTDCNAQAAKWCMDKLIASGQQELPNVKSIDVIDDYTLRINMSQWDILMVNYFALKAGQFYSPTAVQKNGADWALLNPVLTGPFKFESFSRDVSLKFKKFDSYWRTGKPYLDAINWSFIADTMTRKASFQAGEGQIIVDISAQIADELKKTGKYNISSAPFSIIALFPDGANADSSWSNVKVRKAAAYALDTKTIANTFGYGFYPPTNQIGYPGYPMYNPAIKGYPYDTAKAKALLAEAGYPNGFKTTIYTTSPNATLYQAVQGYWKAVGIDASIEIVESSKNSELDTKGWKNGVFTGHGPYVALGYPPAKMLMVQFTKKAMFDVSTYRPNEVDPLLDKAITEDTAELMNKDLQEINRILIDDYCALIPLYVGPNLAAKILTVHDDRIYDPWGDQWYPENTWLEK